MPDTPIEVLDNESSSTSNGVGSHSQLEAGSSYPLAKLLKGVEKSYNTGKKLLDVSEDLTNESSRQASSTQSKVRESRRVSGRLANTGNTSSVAQRIYEEAVRGRAFEWDEAWHDSLVSVKELQDALAKERGVAIRDLENVYLHLVHLSSVSATEMTEYRNQQVENLLDAMGRTARPFVTLRRGAGFQPAETERHLKGPRAFAIAHLDQHNLDGNRLVSFRWSASAGLCPRPFACRDLLYTKVLHSHFHPSHTLVLFVLALGDTCVPQGSFIFPQGLFSERRELGMKWRVKGEG